MDFYILHIEQDSDTAISLFGLQIDSNENKQANTRIKVSNIFTPKLFYSIDPSISIAFSDSLEKYFISKKIAHKITKEKKQNYFYSSFENEIEIYKATYKKKTNLNRLGNLPELFIDEFTSPVEQFIIENRIKGPSRLRIESYEINVNDEISVDDPAKIKFIQHENIIEMKIAVLSIHIGTSGPESFCLCLKETGGSYSKTYFACLAKEGVQNNAKVFSTAGELLYFCKHLLQSENPSLLIFHNIHENIINDLKLYGIIPCDVFITAQALISGRDFTVQELLETLKIDFVPEENEKQSGMFQDLLENNQKIYTIYESLDIFELNRQMTEISGNLLLRTMQNKRAERIEYLLLHELYDKNIIFPIKSKRTKEYSYTGGLVLNPKIGFYESLVLLLDFNSLYPSIIQEFNICFSTVGLFEQIENSKEETEKFNDEALFAKFKNIKLSDKPGFLPKIVSSLVSRRKNIKDIITKTKDIKQRKILDIRQKALKLTANSIYGCLGCSYSRFSNYTMAAYITYKGREILTETTRIAEDVLKLSVIYGDTDSIMIDTKMKGINQNYEGALLQSLEIKNMINSKYSKIEIEVEKVMKKLLLYTKKKYGCLCIKKNGESYLESKGLDFVRRDFAEVSNQIAYKVFSLILTDLEKEYSAIYGDRGYKGYFTEDDFIANNNNGKIIDIITKELFYYNKCLSNLDSKSFLIHTHLKRDPEQYNTLVNLPHVNLALRLKKNGIIYKKDDIISYVVGRGNNNENVSNRTYLINENYVLDHMWYIKSQILPSLHRLTAIYDGISAQNINHAFDVHQVFKETPKSKITINSPCCNKLQQPSRKCEDCRKEIPEKFYIYKAHLMIRDEIKNLYMNEKKCPECGFKTESYFLKCFNCNILMTDVLDNYRFDSFLSSLHQAFLGFENVKLLVESYLGKSEYRNIDMTKYFKYEIFNMNKE